MFSIQQPGGNVKRPTGGCKANLPSPFASALGFGKNAAGDAVHERAPGQGRQRRGAQQADGNAVGHGRAGSSGQERQHHTGRGGHRQRRDQDFSVPKRYTSGMAVLPIPKDTAQPVSIPTSISSGAGMPSLVI